MFRIKYQVLQIFLKLFLLPGRIAYEFLFHQYREILSIPNFEGVNMTYYESIGSHFSKEHILYTIKAYHKESLLISFLTSFSLLIIGTLTALYGSSEVGLFNHFSVLSIGLYWFSLSSILAIVPSRLDIPSLKEKARIAIPSRTLRFVYFSYMFLMEILNHIRVTGFDLILALFYCSLVPTIMFRLFGLIAWTTF